MAMEMSFFLDSPVAFGTSTTAAAYDAATATSVASGASNNTVIYKRLSGACGLRWKFAGIQLSTSISGGTAVVLTAFVRPIVASDTGRRTVGTITIPATAVAGDVIYAVFSDDDIKINPGEECTIELTTKSTTNGAGFITAGYCPFLVGPTSGGSATVPVIRTKPYGTSTDNIGSIKLVSSGTTGN